jgi:hypothetical protein
MIRAQVLEGSWQILGRDILPGVEPREVLPTWGPSGPESLGFTLYRSPSRVHAELRPFTPIEWYPGDRADGPPLWSGYTMQAPPGGDSGVTNVSCVGWHFYREDVPVSALYVHESLADWVDSRTVAEAMASWGAALTSQVDAGGAVLGAGQGVVWPTTKAAGITFDAGPTQRVKQVVVRVLRGAGSPANVSLYVRGHDTVTGSALHFGTSYEDGSFGSAGVSTFSTSSESALVTTYTTARRYVTVLVYLSGATYTTTTEDTVRILSVRLFADTAYASGTTPYPSIFTATQGMTASLARLPLLSTDTSRIATTTFAIPHAAWIKDDATEREQQEAFNAYHGYRQGVDAEKRVFFQPQPSVPRLQVDASDFGVDYVATSTNDGTEVYDHVSVRGKSGSGEELRLDRFTADVYTAGDVPPSGIALTNGDFESGTTTGWTGPGLTAPAGGAQAGTYSLQGATPSVVAGATTGPFVRGRFYRLSGYFRVPANTTSTITIGLGTTSDNRTQNVALSNATGAAVWQAWSVVWQPLVDASSGTVYAYVGGVAGQWDTLSIMDATASNGVLGPRFRKRSFTLNVSAATDLVAMAALAQAWLLAHRSVPHKANLTVTGDAVTDLTAGRQVPASELGRYYGEMIRVLSVPDPDTGALTSRDGVIASVQGSGPASLALDSERRSLEALMARMGVVQGSA